MQTLAFARLPLFLPHGFDDARVWRRNTETLKDGFSAALCMLFLAAQGSCEEGNVLAPLQKRFPQLTEKLP